MPRVHFLNVRNGDTSIIQHSSGRVSVIDISCAYSQDPVNLSNSSKSASIAEARPVSGNFDQKAHPDNPIEYLKKFSIKSIFRFILTHPDMDHLEGINSLFTEFAPINFWDTDNTKEFPDNAFDGRPKLKNDWDWYKNLRDSKPTTDPRRLVYYSGNDNEYYKTDGLKILAPTPKLIQAANNRGNWNDSSYVLLYRTCGKKILFSGDSEDETWDHILANWEEEVSNLDILIAPHHGRDSGRNYDFLNITKPKLTLFGNASSNHLAYQPWNNRDLLIMTNNEGGYFVLDIANDGLKVYCKHETFARKFTEKNSWSTYYSEEMDAWYLGELV